MKNSILVFLLVTVIGCSSYGIFPHATGKQKRATKDCT